MSVASNSITELAFEDKINTFLSGKTGIVNLNPFLKGLFPLQQNPAASIGDSRYILFVLDSMQKKGKFKIVNNLHMKLGETVYPDSLGGRSQQNNLSHISVDVQI